MKRHAVPLIGTIRNQSEGGKADISESLREELYKEISPLVNAIDIDLDADRLESVVAFARTNNNTIILSHHDYNQMPSDSSLQETMGKAVDLGADIIKIAAVAGNQVDVRRLLQFTLTNREKNLVTIAMGGAGVMSRLMFPLAGSLMTYTSLSPSDGQVPSERFIDDLKFYYPHLNQELLVH